MKFKIGGIGMLKFVQGNYLGHNVYIVITQGEFRCFNVHTGQFLGKVALKHLPIHLFKKAVDCEVYSILYNKKTNDCCLAGYSSEGKIMSVSQLTQDVLDKELIKIKGYGLLAHFIITLNDEVLDYVYVVRGGNRCLT